MSDYNGWSNRETWLVAVWFDDSLSGLFCDEIRSLVEEVIDNEVSSNGFVRDLINTNNINYRELAEAYAP